MKELLVILISTAFVNNVVLSRFLGICPFLGVSKKIKTAAGMGTAIIFVVTLSLFLTALIYKFVLVKTGLEFMNTIVFIVVIAALVQLIEMFLKKNVPSLYKALGVYLPLITTNCCVLGTAITNVDEGYNLLQAVVNGIGTSAGFCIAIVIMASIREHLEDAPILKNVKGSPIVLVTGALMAIAFCGFSGIL